MLSAIAVLTIALVIYGVGHYLCALVFSLHRPSDPPPPCAPDAITVLIAARNEGPSAVEAMVSVLEQDHAGPVSVWLLVRDGQDTALPSIVENLECDEERGLDSCEERSGKKVLLSGEGRPGRTFEVLACGSDPKSTKIRQALAHVSTPYVAILDADHVAQPQWLRSSLSLLQKDEGPGRRVRAVQGRRYPKSARGFFRLWDSLHQHVGCELFNIAFGRMGLGVFFTGTTALFETQLLRDYPMRDVITEDADLSYELFFAGEEIVADPVYGSTEEVSADLYSFLARRRRWANGHTEAFLRHLPKLFGARLPILSKLQFLFHGSHYLWALPVFVLHGLVGMLFVSRLPDLAVAGSVIAASLLAFVLARGQRTRGWVHRGVEFSVLAFWLIPAMFIGMNLLTCAILGDWEGARVPLDIPWLQPLALAGLLAPLVVLLVGLFRFDTLGLGTLLSVLLSYPIAFYLDVSGVLLGLADKVVGRRRWRVLEREQPGNLADGWVGVKESCSFGGGVHLSSHKVVPKRWLDKGLLALGLFAFVLGLFGVPDRVLHLDDVVCVRQPADDFPWIEMGDAPHCRAHDKARLGLRSGELALVREDSLDRSDADFWVRGDATFPCNESFFRPANVVSTDEGVQMVVRQEAHADRALTAGALHTRPEDTALHLYGRYEVEMRASAASGVVSAFFLYRFDPWQEIDFEFVGNDTTVALLNVYYNPGDAGELYNYGLMGTPVRVDLGFDASEAFHRYAIEWDRDEIRWFVDGTMIHVRRSGEPTPIPELPMVLHMNAWATCSEALAGPLDRGALPTSATFRRFRHSRFKPAVHHPLDVLFAFGDDEEGAWMRPR